MKRKILLYGAVVASMFLLLGAVAVDQLIIEPKVVTSWGDVANFYYANRSSFPPLPAPSSYTDIGNKMAQEDWSFLMKGWTWNSDGETLYVAKKNQLTALKLPMYLMIYEDLQRGEVVILGSTDGKNYKGMALFEAPELMPFEVGFSRETYLMDELAPRRVVLRVVLKSESEAVVDLFKAEEVSRLSISNPIMMPMSFEDVTDFRMLQDGTNLFVNLPDEFVGADITLKDCTNLVEGTWSSVFTVEGTNSGPFSLGGADIPELIIETIISTNFIDCTNLENCTTHTLPGDPCTNQTEVVSTNNTVVGGGKIFYRATAVSTNDADGDGLDNVTEYTLGTKYLEPDTDGDGLEDGWETQYGFLPLSIDGTNGALGNVDNDGFSNLEEQLNGTNPLQSDSGGVTGLVTTVRYYYDQDDRLTDCFVGAESAEKTSLSSAGDIDEEVSASE